MSPRRATVALALVLLATAAPAAAQDKPAAPKVTVLGPKELAFAAEGGKDTAEAELQVDNPGPAPAQAQLKLDGSTAKSLELEPTTLSVPPGITRPKVKVSGLEALDRKATAYAVITIGEARTVLPVRVTNERTLPRSIVFVALAVFAFLFVVSVAIAAKAKVLTGPAGNAKWTFESWATTLTAAGALLTTVTSAATLPEVPRRFDKETLVELSLVFALVLVAAPFLAKVFRKRLPEGTPDEKAKARIAEAAGVTSHHWAVLLGASLTGAAVIGQLLTLHYLGRELTNGATARTAVSVVSIALLVGASLYLWRTIFHELAPRDWMKEATAAAEAAAKAYQRVKLVPDAEVAGATTPEAATVAVDEAPPPAQPIVFKMP